MIIYMSPEPGNSTRTTCQWGNVKKCENDQMFKCSNEQLREFARSCLVIALEGKFGL